jgi:hypothetical protein
LKKVNISNLKLKLRYELDEYYNQIPLQQIQNNVDGISVVTNLSIDPTSNDDT